MSGSHVHIEAPAHLDAFDIAQAVVGDRILLKAEYNEDPKTFSRWPAMAQLYRLVMNAYDEQTGKILRHIREYVDKNVLHREGPHMFSPANVMDIQQLIRDYHAAFAANTVHPDVLPPDEIERLAKKGITPASLMNFVDDAYNYGRSLIPVRSPQRLEDSRMIGLPEFKTRKQTPLKLEEIAALDWARHSAATYIKGLGDKISTDFSSVALEADKEQRAQYEQLIREGLATNIAKREGWRKLASDIGHQTGDWSRGMGRIAATEKQHAMQAGIATGLQSRTGLAPGGIMVAKQPNPDACPDCDRLHLTAGKGSPPRIFPLSELEKNGTNVGKRKNEWKAIVGPVHPWCFPPGTPVCADEGHMLIESIRAGQLVQTAFGRLRAVKRLSQRLFSGDLIVLACGEEELKLTPEHPVLTTMGWLPAHAVQVGQSLLQTPQLVSANADPENDPAEGFDEAFLARVLRSLSIRGVPVGIDLHDAAEVGESNIGVEDTYRQLWNALVSSLLESAKDHALVGSEDAARLACVRRLHLLPDRARLSFDSAMSCLSEAQSIYRTTGFGYEETLRANGTYDDAPRTESFCDRTPGSTEGVRQLFDALAAVVAGDDLIDWKQQSFGHDVAYHAVAVTSIRKQPYVGPVFNFAVDEDESYVASGFVVHNCGCELIEVPEGWAFDKHNNLVPEEMLRKADMTHSDIVPEKGVVVRISDPHLRTAVEAVIADTPAVIFDKRIGVTLITSDHPRVQNPLDEHDLAYWTGHEIRLMHNLSPTLVPRVLRHELGHSLNAYLIRRLGGTKEVRTWHDDLWKVSKDEGFVSEYAKKLPIENAAEVSMLYIYERQNLMLHWPRQFAFVHKFYAGIFRKARRAIPFVVDQGA